MKYEVIIKADTNDGDYVTSMETVGDAELKLIREVCKAIKDFQPYTTEGCNIDWRDWTHSHNWPEGECLREDLGEKSPSEIYSQCSQEALDLFRELIPYGEYGIHTIESVTVSPVVAREKLL
jgi:hypothetical protein